MPVVIYNIWYSYFSDLLLQQQLLCMGDAVLVGFSCFRGHGEENRCF